MPLVSGSELIETYRRMIAGEVAIVGWGALRGVLGYYDWLCPWPFKMIVDNDRSRWGLETIGTEIASPEVLRRFSPARSVVVVLPPRHSRSFSQIVEQIDRIGPYRCVPSRPLVRIAALDGPTTSRATREEVLELMEILDDWGDRSVYKSEVLRALYRIARCAGIRAASRAHCTRVCECARRRRRRTGAGESRFAWGAWGRAVRSGS